MGDVTTQAPTTGNTTDSSEPALKSDYAPLTPFDAQTGLPSYYATAGAPFAMGQKFGEADIKPVARQFQAERDQTYQKIATEADNKASAARNASVQKQLEQEAAGTAPSTLQRGQSSGEPMFFYGLPIGAAAMKQLGDAKNKFADGLIAAGVIMIALAAIGIWLGAAGVENALAMRQAEKNGTPLSEQKKYAGLGKAAYGASIAAVVLGSIGTFLSLLSVFTGQTTVGLTYGVLMAALLIVGAIAVHKLQRGDASDNKGFWAHFASGLWIASMVVFLLLPGVAALSLGAILK